MSNVKFLSKNFFLIRFFLGGVFTDLGPFRAIKQESLSKLSMKDKTYGWTVEMQIKAVKNSLKYMEVPVSYKSRIGKSKVSGTIIGSIKAGTIFCLYKRFKSSFKSGHIRTILSHEEYKRATAWMNAFQELYDRRRICPLHMNWIWH